DRDRVVGRLCAAEAPLRALHLVAAGLDLGPALGIDRHDLPRIDAELLPWLVDRTPVTLEPAAVLVRTVSLRLPLRSRREELGVARHVEVALRVLYPPPVRTVVAEEHRVRVDLVEDLQIAIRLDLEDGLRFRAESLDL